MGKGRAYQWNSINQDGVPGKWENGELKKKSYKGKVGPDYTETCKWEIDRDRDRERETELSVTELDGFCGTEGF